MRLFRGAAHAVDTLTVFVNRLLHRALLAQEAAPGTCALRRHVADLSALFRFNTSLRCWSAQRVRSRMSDAHELVCVSSCLPYMRLGDAACRF